MKVFEDAYCIQFNWEYIGQGESLNYDGRSSSPDSHIRFRMVSIDMRAGVFILYMLQNGAG